MKKSILLLTERVFLWPAFAPFAPFARTLPFPGDCLAKKAKGAKGKAVLAKLENVLG